MRTITIALLLVLSDAAAAQTLQRTFQDAMGRTTGRAATDSHARSPRATPPPSTTPRVTRRESSGARSNDRAGVSRSHRAPGLSQVGAARFLGVNDTTSRRWIATTPDPRLGRDAAAADDPRTSGTTHQAEAGVVLASRAVNAEPWQPTCADRITLPRPVAADLRPQPCAVQWAA